MSNALEQLLEFWINSSLLYAYFIQLARYRAVLCIIRLSVKPNSYDTGGIILSEVNNENNTRCLKESNQSGHHERRELARAYVPMQGFGEISRPEVGLRNGTIFPELVSLYVRKKTH